MGIQNNYFVRKRSFSMRWNGGYGFENSKKVKHRSLRESATPFPYSVWPWEPFNALFVLCRSPVSAATLANANLSKFARSSRQFVPIFAYRYAITVTRIFTSSAMNCPNILCSLFALFAASETLRKGMYIVEVTEGPLAGPPSQLLYGHRALPTHGPLCDVPPLRTEAVV